MRARVVHWVRCWSATAILVMLSGCSGTSGEPGARQTSSDIAGDATMDAASPTPNSDAGSGDSGSKTPDAVAQFRAHVDAMKGAWKGTSTFVYDDDSEPDIHAEESLGVREIADGHFVYSGHWISGLAAEWVLEMSFENGSVVAIPPKATLTPQIWTLLVERASSSEVGYRLDVEIPASGSRSREVIVERLSPDKMTLTRRTKVYFEDRFIGTREAIYTRTAD